MAVSLGNVTLFMGPSDVGAPDDLEATIVSFIDKAEHRLDIAVQELESHPICEAIIRARARGVKVRMVLESDYLRAKSKPHPEPFMETGPHEPNRMLFAALLRADVDVKMDYNPKIFHQKFIVRDMRRHGDKVIAERRHAMLTGSTNFTPTGVRKNLNHLITIKSKPLEEAYFTEFEEIWNGTFGTKRLRHDERPVTRRVSGIRVKQLFAPDHAPEMEIMKQMLKAKSRIDFAIFTFAQSSGIDDTMIALANGGIKIRGIFDGNQGAQKWAATKGIEATRNTSVHFAKKGGGLNKLHHKLMVIDEQLVIGGSFNYTGPANDLNDENIVILGDLDEEKPDAITKQKEVASFALAEIERMIADHGPDDDD